MYDRGTTTQCPCVRVGGCFFLLKMPHKTNTSKNWDVLYSYSKMTNKQISTKWGPDGVWLLCLLVISSFLASIIQNNMCGSLNMCTCACTSALFSDLCTKQTHTGRSELVQRRADVGKAEDWEARTVKYLLLSPEISHWHRKSTSLYKLLLTCCIPRHWEEAESTDALW